VSPQYTQVAGAQLCYVVAGSGLHWAPEPGEAGAKLSLVGANAGELPRTAASIPALQRTQLYHWAMALGKQKSWTTRLVTLPLLLSDR